MERTSNDICGEIGPDLMTDPTQNNRDVPDYPGTSSKDGGVGHTHPEPKDAEDTEGDLGPPRNKDAKQGFARYKNAMRNLVPFRCENKTEGMAPVDNAGLFSFILLSWASKYIYKGYRSGFIASDWPALSRTDRCDPNGQRLESLWKDELARHGPENASFNKVVWRFTRTRVLILMSLYAMKILCVFAGQTLVARRLIEHVESPEETYDVGIKLAMLLTLFELLQILFLAGTFAIAHKTCIQLKVACTMLLYRKIINQNQLRNTSIGELINLFATDSLKVSEMVIYGPFVIEVPVMIICGVWYILRLLGPTALVGMLIFVLFIPIQYGICRLMGRLSVKRNKVSDKRVRLTYELLDHIKLIKMYAWEKCFGKNILDIRTEQHKFIFRTNYCHNSSFALSSTVAVISSMTTFLAHMWFGGALTAAQAFPIATFFGSRVPYTLMVLQQIYHYLIEGFIALNRLENALLMEEASCAVCEPYDENRAIVISHGTFAYDSFVEEKVEDSTKADNNGTSVPTSSGNASATEEPKPLPRIRSSNVLFDITFEVGVGELVGICGPVGAGKTTLLLAALGQLPAIGGRVMKKGSCAYVSQEAWIINATLRDNILFGEPFDVERFQTALRVCNLIHDINTMPEADQTVIGEKGINLSGGQKQRVALARAFYARRDIYILDDPLSAVDARVGSQIFDQLIMTALRGKTVLFVTHQIQYLNRCDDVYMMRAGRIVEHGTHDVLMEMNQEYASMVNSTAVEASEDAELEDVRNDIDHSDGMYDVPLTGIHESAGHYSRSIQGSTQNRDGSRNPKNDASSSSNKPEPASIVTEVKKEILVSGNAYLSYASAAGGCLAVFITFGLSAASVGSIVFGNWWLAEWINASEGRETNLQTNKTVASIPMKNDSEFYHFEMVYGITMVIVLVSDLSRSFVVTKFALRASSTLHEKFFKKTIESSMRFFDTTPVGRIQNIFSNDLNEVDNRIPTTTDYIIHQTFLACAALTMISVFFPWFVLPIFVLVLSAVFFFKVAGISIKALQHEESNTRSPILSHVTTTIHGLSTIHAFDKVKDFEDTFSNLVDKNSSYLFMLITVKKWIGIRIENLTLLTSLTTALLVVCTKGQIPSAIAGLILMNAAYVAQICQCVIRFASDAESRFISVERINQYISRADTNEESSDTAPRVQPKPGWPTAGVVEFRDVELTYDHDTPLVLKGVSFKVNSQEKIGIVGRTGAGKSSLTVALFRLVELSGGQITIDDVDISKIGFEQLRSRLCIIPQEPVMFSGTIRSNLDPMRAASDAEIWKVLEKTKLKERVRSIDGQLDAIVGYDGNSLSVGETQLLCLARAILRETKILVLDEATAAIDPETEIAVKDTIQREFADATVLTIAHRLQTVVSCDRILVMDDGRVAEFAKPSDLLADENSHFSKMLKAAKKSMKQ